MKLQLSKRLLPAILLLASIASFSQTTKYIDKANMDLSVKPGDNFYQYANGTWIKNNPVPASRTRWGSFDELRQESTKRLQTLLDNATKASNPDRKTKIIGDFYKSGMDSAAIEAKGYQPIKADLDRINNLASVNDVIHEVISFRVNGLGSPLFGTGVSPDRKNVLVYIPTIGQGGTSLPDRDYYLKDDTRSKKIRDAYKMHVQKMFSLVGEDAKTSAADAAAVLKIETTLAAAQMSRIEMRDPNKTYHKFAVKDLSATTSNLDWASILSEAKINGADSVLAGNPEFLKKVNSMLTEVPLNDWKSYLRWHLIRSAAPYLSHDFVDADFEFNKVQTGQKVPTPRWERMSNLIDRMLGDLIGQIYVEKYFKPEAKDYMVKLVNNMQATFADRIKRLDWMSEATKQKALEKLNAMVKKIAYPDKWRTYDGIEITATDYYKNVRSCSVWFYNFNVSRMGKPVDRTEMGMTPPTINASYSPSNNDLTFPAGILQFPFFDFGADDAVNYGGIAAVIGHEMTHGFDDQGRQFDAVGNLKDWWTKEDADKFIAKADEVVKQYDALTVQDSIHVKGKLTLGENLADLGGLSIAYEAFSKTEQFKKGKKIDGFTPQQRFFLSWAQVWRNNILPDAEAQLILTDPHAPGVHRGNAPLTNIDAWYKAFKIKASDKMYKAPETRTHIW